MSAYNSCWWTGAHPKSLSICAFSVLLMYKISMISGTKVSITTWIAVAPTLMSSRSADASYCLVVNAVKTAAANMYTMICRNVFLSISETSRPEITDAVPELQEGTVFSTTSFARSDFLKVSGPRYSLEHEYNPHTTNEIVTTIKTRPVCAVKKVHIQDCHYLYVVKEKEN